MRYNKIMRYMYNPWHGCHKVSEACKNCYVFYFDRKRGIDSEVVKKNADFDLIIRKDRKGEYKIPDGAEVAVCLTSDFFLKEADPWRDEVWQMMKSRPKVKFVIFTKRCSRIKECLPYDFGEGYDHIAINLTCENQRRADERLPIFIELPVKTKGVIVSPMLEEVDMKCFLKTGKIDYVYVSGENYEGARPINLDWVMSLREQCVRTNTTFNFYDTGAKLIKDGRLYNIPARLGKMQANKAGLNFEGKFKF